ncbi:hypothetical protein Cmtc_08650 [Cupriavidus sp. TKC]|uniref:hypothetical protein n=1 Tax=Cupriavidus sp. TKC TaxID=2880159 RepID=UPI0025A87AD0|nr:hypothetical protein [Cupriavidus sp. TKC]GMG89645.1 hypothetical protein Cmtc_08650 [Cupriavidus sp. TKC]
MKMFSIQVEAVEGMVELRQRDDHGNEELILLTGEQALIVSRWIHRAAVDAMEEEFNG